MDYKSLFKGGPIELHSSGIGPDDYLLKPINGGRWQMVICRWGRHWEHDNELADSDKLALGWVMARTEPTCVSDNARQFAKMCKRGWVERVPMTQFAADNGWPHND